MRTLFFLLLTISNILIIKAQDLENLDLDLLIQEIFAQGDDDLNYEEIYDNFYTLIADPIRLNRAEVADLQKLYLLSDRQITHFFEYKKRNGHLLSVYELQAIPEWDLTTIQKILPFVQIRETELTADTRSLWERIKAEKNNYLLLRWERTLESKYGYRADSLDNPYLGSPNRVFLRFRMSHTRDFSLDFRAEKDAGEQFIIHSKSKRYGFDYYSGHFMILNQNRIKKWIIGDYRIQIGQGLISSAGFNLGKGAESIQTIRRNSLGILPYGSVTEFGFLRGSALTYEMAKNCTFTGFISHKNRDATPVFHTDSTQILHFKSRTESGYHRTPSELQKKNLLQETVLGANLQWQSPSKNTELGLTWLYLQFDKPIISDLKVYQRFDFQGDKNTSFGFHYSKVWENFNFFGETALTPQGGYATLNGMMASLSRAIDLAILWRKYSPNFYNFYGNAFGENYTNRNESGLYFGLKYAPNRDWKWTIYYDRFRFPWLKYQVSSPSEGYEFMTQITRNFSRSISAYFRIRMENKERNFRTEIDKNYILTPSLRMNYQFNLDYAMRNQFSMRSRIQFSNLQQKGKPKTEGFAMIQDLNWNFKNTRISTRFALFDTDDFENRQYVYEKDVLYYFAMPAYYGKGLRSYVLFQQKFTKNIDFWLKYAVYSYQNRSVVGSGLERIEGNRKRDVRFQVKYQF